MKRSETMYGNFTSASDNAKKERDYLETLKIQQRLNNLFTEQTQDEYFANLHGISAPPTQVKTGEEELEDQNKQRSAAIKNLRMLKLKEANVSNILETLTDSDELLLFNQNFAPFVNFLKGKQIQTTVGFFNDWDRFKGTIGALGPTGMESQIRDLTNELKAYINLYADDIKEKNTLLRALETAINDGNAELIREIGRALAGGIPPAAVPSVGIASSSLASTIESKTPESKGPESKRPESKRPESKLPRGKPQMTLMDELKLMVDKRSREGEVITESKTREIFPTELLESIWKSENPVESDDIKNIDNILKSFDRRIFSSDKGRAKQEDQAIKRLLLLEYLNKNVGKEFLRSKWANDKVKFAIISPESLFEERARAILDASFIDADVNNILDRINNFNFDIDNYPTFDQKTVFPEYKEAKEEAKKRLNLGDIGSVKLKKINPTDEEPIKQFDIDFIDEKNNLRSINDIIREIKDRGGIPNGENFSNLPDLIKRVVTESASGSARTELNKLIFLYIIINNDLLNVIGSFSPIKDIIDAANGNAFATTLNKVLRDNLGINERKERDRIKNEITKNKNYNLVIPRQNEPSGTGIRKQKKKRGRRRFIDGLGISQDIESPHYGEKRKDNFYNGKKLSTIVQFGDQTVYLPDLYNSIFNYRKNRTAKGRSIVITPEIATCVWQIIKTGKPNKADVESLSDEEFALFCDILNICKLDREVGVFCPHSQSANRQRRNYDDYKRFNVLRGEIVAGNNNPEILKELKQLTLKLLEGGVIKRKDCHNLLLELTSL